MSLEYVKVPKPVTIMGGTVTPDGVYAEKEFRTLTMFDFVRETLTNDTLFGRSHKMIMAACDLEAKFAGSQPGDYVEMTSELMDHVKKVFESPNPQYQPAVAKQMAPFFAAFMKTFTKDEVENAKKLGAAGA